MPPLFVQIDFLQGTVEDFGWTEDLAASLGQLDLDARIRVSPSHSGREVAPLGPGDLQDLMFDADPAVRDEAFLADGWYVYLIVAMANPDFLGVMFDVDFDLKEREGCALFANSIKALAGNDGGLLRRLFARTALHELGHCLNLIHPVDPSDVSLMAETRNLSTAPAWPGNITFDYSLADQHFCIDNPEQSRPGSDAEFRGKSNADGAAESSTLDVRLEAVGDEKTGRLSLGCPLTLLLHFENRGQRTRTIYESPGFTDGSLVLEIGRRRDPQTRLYDFPFHSCGWRRTRRLLPGKSWTTSVSILFHRGGFAFAEAGQYRLRARVKNAWRRPPWLLTDWLEVQIEQPEELDPEFYRLLFDPALGQYLELSGTRHLEAAHERAVALAEAYPSCPPTGYLLHCISRVRKSRALAEGRARRAARRDLRRAAAGFQQASRIQEDPVARMRSTWEELEIMDLGGETAATTELRSEHARQLERFSALEHRFRWK